MTSNQPIIRTLVIVGATVLHSIFFGIAFDLTVTEHGKTRKCRHQGTDAEIFVPLPKLLDRGLLVGIVHEVDVALENVGIELEGVLDYAAIVGVLLVAQHIHECAVVDAMHTESANEVAFHEPEGFGKEKSAGDFTGNAIDDLAPEFDGHGGIKFRLGKSVLGARWNGAAGTGLGEPETLVVLLCERHCGVEANDGKHSGDVKNGLDYGFANFGVEIVQLGGVVPGKTGAVVAVIDVAGFARPAIDTTENYGGVGLVVVVVFNLDFDAAVAGEIGTFKAVRRVWRMRQGQEPVGMLNYPAGVDAHVVGNHVAGEANASA